MKKLFFTFLLILIALVIHKKLSLPSDTAQPEKTIEQTAENETIPEETDTQQAQADSYAIEEEEKHPELTGNDDETTLEDD